MALFPSVEEIRWLRMSKHWEKGHWEMGRGKVKRAWSLLDFVLCSVEDN